MTTCKEHKSPTGFRPIHASPSHPFEGLQRAVSFLLNRRLRNFKHIFDSTDGLRKVLASTRFPPTCKFVHVDISDFYMIGKHSFLTKHASELVGKPGVKKEVNKSLEFILSHQFVKSIFLTLFFQMVEGSGQGSVHSAATASAAFCHSRELNSPGLATRKFAVKHKIFAYYRYADNLLFVLEDDSCFDSLMSDLSCLHPYVVKPEEISDFAVTVLDVRYYKGSRFNTLGLLDHCPVIKDKGISLGFSSAHLESTIRQYPLQVIRRLARNSSSEAIFVLARDVYIHKLRNSGFPQDYLSWLFDNTQFRYYTTDLNHIPIVSKPKSSVRPFRLVLPFHPVLRSAVGPVVKHFRMHGHSVLAKLFGSSEITVSWRLTTTPLVSSLFRWS